MLLFLLERAESEDGDDSNESCYDADAEGDVEATRNRERNSKKFIQLIFTVLFFIKK